VGPYTISSRAETFNLWHLPLLSRNSLPNSKIGGSIHWEVFGTARNAITGPSAT
jgi:hypothetical protein